MIEIWHIDAAAEADRLAPYEAVLTAAERDGIARFRQPEDRLLRTVARGALRLLLGRRTGTAPEALVFEEGPQGKLALAGGPHFNLSHCRGQGLIGIGDRPLGVDVEREDRTVDWRGLCRMVAAPREVEAIEAAPEHDRARLFMSLWTAKESYVKALGIGIGHPLREVQVIGPGGTLPTVLDTSQPRDAREPWRLHPLASPPGYLSCLCHPGPAAPVREQAFRA
ncbi:MAG TPA: 4'-phosphopantetheinyl transferase superfamily protein [Azospirillaceae bacterium]|nr:4'-phosphopantetheinyl transferase superfamily protein [Azospirillaceae bacterium]